MKSKRWTLAALAAFVFAGSLVATASAIPSQCLECYTKYQACVANGGSDCAARHTLCLKRYLCPL
ncbi:hypothetical protein [Lysobacter sp. CA199]|uniref:hypothetical protein n=1 Tax=Lysobacter sp. CA199 TaxID=3455608 RepID=UPI003F8D5DE0